MTKSNNDRQEDIPNKVLQSTVDHFKSIPFARKTVDDPNFQIVSMSRTITHSGKGHTLMAKTWNTPGTIEELLTLFRPSTSQAPFPQPEHSRAETRRFYTFGPDLNAPPDLLHGGVVASILDSSVGGVVGLVFREEDKVVPRFTVQLNVTYKNPVRTPATVMVRSWIMEVKEGGRKVWAKGVVESEGGVVHAVAEGMWLQGRPKL